MVFVLSIFHHFFIFLDSPCYSFYMLDKRATSPSLEEGSHIGDEPVCSTLPYLSESCPCLSTSPLPPCSTHTEEKPPRSQDDSSQQKMNQLEL